MSWLTNWLTTHGSFDVFIQFDCRNLSSAVWLKSAIQTFLLVSTLLLKQKLLSMLYLNLLDIYRHRMHSITFNSHDLKHQVHWNLIRVSAGFTKLTFTLLYDFGVLFNTFHHCLNQICKLLVKNRRDYINKNYSPSALNYLHLYQILSDLLRCI